jgi:hypothetical protein
MAQLDGDTLSAPVEIAPNLQAGVRVGGGWVTVGYSDSQGFDGRTRYRWEIIFPDGSDMHGHDLRSGCGGGDLTLGLESLLAFLSAAAESCRYRMATGREGENEDLFPPNVVEFAYQHDDEISLLQCEIEESRKGNRT